MPPMKKKRRLDKEEDPFQLNLVPTLLQNLIVEKMFYQTFATFNLCSKDCAYLCDRFPSSTTIQRLHLNNIHMENETYGEYSGRKAKELKRTPLEIAPENVLYTCDTLHIYQTYRLDALSLFGVKANRIHYHNTDWDLEFIEEVIQLTEASSFVGKAQQQESIDELMELDEVKKMTDVDVSFYSTLLESDEAFLSIKTKKIEVSGDSGVTPDGIRRFIQDWRNGSRKIEKLLIKCHFTKEELLETLPREYYAKEGKNLRLSRPNHNGCLLLQMKEYVYNSRLQISPLGCYFCDFC